MTSFRVAQDKDPWWKDPRTGLNPQRKAEVLAINGLLDKGSELAKQGQLKEAAALFTQVKSPVGWAKFRPMNFEVALNHHGILPTIRR